VRPRSTGQGFRSGDDREAGAKHGLARRRSGRDDADGVQGSGQASGGVRIATGDGDNFTLVKDKYARDNNVYMLDTAKVGELVRRDFTWITNGEKEGVLQRRPGTELYEGIMNKYADMYVDSFRGHAVIKNARIPTVGGVVEWHQ
jgi:hypothetical protein